MAEKWITWMQPNIEKWRGNWRKMGRGSKCTSGVYGAVSTSSSWGEGDSLFSTEPSQQPAFKHFTVQDPFYLGQIISHPSIRIGIVIVLPA